MGRKKTQDEVSPVQEEPVSYDPRSLEFQQRLDQIAQDPNGYREAYDTPPVNELRGDTDGAIRVLKDETDGAPLPVGPPKPNSSRPFFSEDEPTVYRGVRLERVDSSGSSRRLVEAKALFTWFAYAAVGFVGLYLVYRIVQALL